MCDGTEHERTDAKLGNCGLIFFASRDRINEIFVRVEAQRSAVPSPLSEGTGIPFHKHSF